MQVQGTRAQPPTGLISWFSKTEGNTYATLLHHPFLFKEIQRGAQEVAVASLKIACITVGEQLTAEQLIEKRIVMKISKAMVMNIGITSVSSNDSRKKVQQGSPILLRQRTGQNGLLW